MKRFWNDQRLANVIARMRAGETIPLIAASYKRDKSSLYRIIQRHRHELKLPYAPIPGRASWSATLVIPADPAIRAYIAGIIDGEGSIYWAKASRHWNVAVKMTDRNVCRWLSRFGASLNFYRPKNKTHKPVYDWRVSRNRDVAILLDAICPYLLTKRALALYVLRSHKKWLS